MSEDLKKRSKEWVKLSHQIAGIVKEPMISIDIQRLGRMDVDLLRMEHEILDKFTKPTPDIESGLEADRLITYSYLWVLGVYEIARIIDKHNSQKNFKNTKEVHELFRRVRIPLAKREVARYYEKTDSKIAYPTILLDVESGNKFRLGWEVSPRRRFITRKELSDTFLGLKKD